MVLPEGEHRVGVALEIAVQRKRRAVPIEGRRGGSGCADAERFHARGRTPQRPPQNPPDGGLAARAVQQNRADGIGPEIDADEKRP